MTKSRNVLFSFSGLWIPKIARLGSCYFRMGGRMTLSAEIGSLTMEWQGDNFFSRLWILVVAGLAYGCLRMGVRMKGFFFPWTAWVTGVWNLQLEKGNTELLSVLSRGCGYRLSPGCSIGVIVVKRTMDMTMLMMARMDFIVWCYSEGVEASPWKKLWFRMGFARVYV